MKILGKIPPWLLLCLFSLSHTTETVYTSALPSISASLHVSGNLAQLSSSIYFLGFSLGILFLGPISDRFGRRVVAISGIVLYIIVSIISIFVKEIETLLVLRFLQAFGASVSSVIAQAMARDSYQGHQLSYVYASLSMSLAFIPSVGSTIGGYIVEYLGWRYNFVFLSIASSLLLLTCLKFLPETNPYIGEVRKSKYLQILKVVLKDRVVLLYAVIIGAFNGMLFGFYLEAPFIFIEKIGLSPSNYGKLVFLLSASNLSGSIISRYLVGRYVDNKKIITSGLILSLVGCILLNIGAMQISFGQTDKMLAIVLIFPPMMLHAIGHSLLVPLCLRYALEDYAKVTGTAGSVFGWLYYMLVAIINFTVSKLHSETIAKFTLLFLGLSAICTVCFYYIQKLTKLKAAYKLE